MKILKTLGTAKIGLRYGHVHLITAGVMLITTGSRHASAARLISARTGVGTGSPLRSPQVSRKDAASLVEIEGEVEIEVKSGLGRLIS